MDPRFLPIHPPSRAAGSPPSAATLRSAPGRTPGRTLVDAFEAILLREILKPLEESVSGRQGGPFASGGAVLSDLWMGPLAERLAAGMDLFGADVWASLGLDAAAQAAGATALGRTRASSDPIPSPRRMKDASPPAAPVAGEARGAANEPEAVDHAVDPETEALLRPLARLDPLIAAVSEEVGLAANWIRAVVLRESSGRPDAVSSKGAMGLMQLMPATADALGVRDPMNPLENLRGGARYLKGLLERFGDARLAVAAYHSGPTRVARHGGVPPIRSTQSYVRKVLDLKASLDRLRL